MVLDEKEKQELELVLFAVGIVCCIFGLGGSIGSSDIIWLAVMGIVILIFDLLLVTDVIKI